MSSPPHADSNGRDSVTAAATGNDDVLTSVASSEQPATQSADTPLAGKDEAHADAASQQQSNGYASGAQENGQQPQEGTTAAAEKSDGAVNGHQSTQTSVPTAGAEGDASQSIAQAGTGAEKATGNGSEDAAAVAAVEADAAAEAVANAGQGSSAAAAAAAAAAHKKFTSLNVTKQFLQKASPTLTAASASPYGKLGASSLSSSGSRLSSMPPSRLTAAKLSGTSKPASPGWASVGPAAGASVASSSDPSPAGAAQASSSPRLAAFARSTSPHVKGADGVRGSPGLRNAAIAGRSASPGTAATQGGKAPWAAVKGDGSAPRPSTRMSEFPTTAELARAKQAAEEKEKQQAAQAAARAERALQNLDSFRGTHLDSGNRWDDMEDDDFGEVLKFADGTQYKVPVREEVAERSRTPITKEERFKDVSHDRSWPPRNAGQDARRPPTARVPSEQPRQVSSSKPARAETMAIHSGEGVSLDAMPSERPAWGPPRERGPPPGARRDRDEGRGASERPGAAASAAPAATTNVRAWGPLAQRQAALNPDAPKPVAPAPQPVVTSPSQQQAPAVKAAAPPQAKALARQPESVDSSRPRRPSNQAQQAPSHPMTSPSAPIARTIAGKPTLERGLPPHLAARQAQGSSPGAAPLRPMHAERPDWETAAPKVIEEPPAKEARPSPFGAARPSVQDTKKGEATELPEAQRGEMLSAAERARRRRQQEEEERAKEKERALAKAAAIEAKMQRQRDAEEEKKRAEMEKQQARKEQQQRKAAEQREVRAAKSERRDAGVVAAQPEEGLKPEAAPSRAALLSPSDEAISWRRAHAVSAESAAPGSRPKAPEEQQIRAAKSPEVAPTGPQRILLRRPEAAQQPSAGPTRENAQLAAPIPTGPRADRQIDDRTALPKGPRAAAGKDGVAPTDRKAPRVEILAPTDKGAAQHMRDQEKGKRARQEAGPSVSPVSAMKQPVGSRRPPAVHIPKPQPLQSKAEVEFDPPPVWNKFKVKVGPSKPRERLRRQEFKAQQARVARAKAEIGMPAAPELLSWSPPIANLPTRTLSRDDMLFPKKYRKGVVISTISLPKMSMAELAVQRKAEREALGSKPSVLLPSNKASANKAKSDSNGANAATENLARSEQSAGTVQPSRDTRGVVAFAQARDAPDRTAPSPVNFMLGSDLTSGRADKSLPASATQQRSMAKPSPALPSPGRMSSTWGQSSLTFAGLQPESNEPAGEEQNHIKSMWAQSPINSKGQALPSQNSLRGIADELPAVMSMSMQDLRTEDGPSTDAVRTAQYQDVGINTASSAPISRVYSPLAHSKVMDVDGLTASSSPLVAQSGSSNETALNEELERSMSRARSQSPTQGRYGRSDMSTSMSFPGQNVFLQQDKGGASAAFGPYAYPNTPAGYQAMQNALNQQQQAYGKGAYGSGRQSNYFANEGLQYGAQRGGRGVNSLPYMQQAATATAINGYNSRMSDYTSFSPGLADMSAAALGTSLSGNAFSGAGWPLDSPGLGYGNGSALSSNAFGAQASAYGQHGYGAGYRQAQNYPHGRTTSSGYGQQTYPRGGYQQNVYGGMHSSAGGRSNGYRNAGAYDMHSASSAMAAAAGTPSGMHANAKPFRAGSTGGRENNAGAVAGAAGYGGGSANGGNASGSLGNDEAVAGMNGSSLDEANSTTAGTASRRMW